MGQTALGGWESVESVLGERFLQEPCEEVYSGQDKLGLRLPSLSTDATPRVKAGRANGRVKQWQRGVSTRAALSPSLNGNQPGPGCGTFLVQETQPHTKACPLPSRLACLLHKIDR